MKRSLIKLNWSIIEVTYIGGVNEEVWGECDGRDHSLRLRILREQFTATLVIFQTTHAHLNEKKTRFIYS